jgi:PKD repeat protein
MIPSLSEIYTQGPFPPVASISSSPNAGLAPLTVQFSSAGSSDPYGLALNYSWDFGDGSPLSTATNPSHIYTTNGTYTATLTVSNGTQNASTSIQEVVGSTPPTASIRSPAVNATYNGGRHYLLQRHGHRRGGWHTSRHCLYVAG